MNSKIVKKLIGPILLFIFFPILIVIFTVAGGNLDQNVDISHNLDAAVENYRITVTEKAKKYQMDDYVDLILCVMQIESNGLGLDPMQASEGPFNKRYPKQPNGITDPDYSIECGIQELKSVLEKSNVQNPEDKEHIKVALAGYNFGSGFIDWIYARGGKWTLKYAEEFSAMMADRMGWNSYGDPEYVNKVMNIYEDNEFLAGDGDFIAPEKKYAFTSDFGPRALGDFHYGVDIDGGYGANIYAPASGTVYAASNTCPPNNGYLGNMCPYNAYMGGGNYVMIKTKYKEKTYYIFICHMKRAIVTDGQTVKKGQKIGEQGHSGNSTASHAHIEIHENTATVGSLTGIIDPKLLIKFEK